MSTCLNVDMLVYVLVYMYVYANLYKHVYTFVYNHTERNYEAYECYISMLTYDSVYTFLNLVL